MSFEQPSDFILASQIVLALSVAFAYAIRALRLDGKMGPERIFQIIGAATSALILPFACVIIYSAFNPAALEWVKKGDFRLSFLVIGVGALAYAAANLKNNWPS